MFKKYRGETALVVTSIIAALGWIFSKNAVMLLPPIGFNSMRFGFAALVLLPFALPQLKRLSREQWLHSAVVGLCLLCSISCYVIALKSSSELGKGSFITSLYILVAPLLAWAFFRERPKNSFALSFVSALAGLYFLNSNIGSMSLGFDGTLFLCAAFLSAVQYVMNNRYARTVPVLALTTITLGLVGIVHGVYSVLFETFPETIDSSAWLWVLLSVLLATDFRFLLQTYGQKYSDVASGAAIMMLEPIWTMLLSIALMGEVLSTNKLIGCCLIFAALCIYRFDFLIGRLFLRKRR